jgi:hypothetical protein
MTLTDGESNLLFSEAQARDEIEAFWYDFASTRVEEPYWQDIRTVEAIKGHDRETFEYSLHLLKQSKIQKRRSGTSSKGYYYIELSGPMETPEKLQVAADLDEIPAF